MMPDPKKPLTIESLLHLKRSERPPEDFWAQFESELRAKQLAAIVGPRPWWREFSLRSLLKGAPLAVGAAAAAFAAIFSVREFRSHSAASGPVQPVSGLASVSSHPLPVAVVALTPAHSDTAAQTSGFVVSAATAPARALPRTAPAHAQPSLVARLVQTPPIRMHFSDPLDSTGEQLSGVGLSQPATFAFANANAGAAASWASATVSRAPDAEPLARTVTPADERRAALLNGIFPATNAVWQTTSANEGRAEGLSDDRLYQAVRRLGVGGNRLLIRF